MDLSDPEKAMFALLSEFFFTFRCIHEPRLTYAVHVSGSPGGHPSSSGS